MPKIGELDFGLAPVWWTVLVGLVPKSKQLGCERDQLATFFRVMGLPLISAQAHLRRRFGNP